MGLDMYLSATKYVGGWNHTKNRTMYDKLVELTGVAPTDESPAFVVEATVGYWRKANAIHKWFVANVQEDVDNCAAYDVRREQLAELRTACLRVIHAMTKTMKSGKVAVDAAAAEELLPTTEGFFFGSTTYDEYYIEDLQGTVAIIDRVLDNRALDGWGFRYRASW